ncbi:hypothetical protein D9M71_666620 [compost metagenome]
MAFSADVLPRADMRELSAELTKLLINPTAAPLQCTQYLFITSAGRCTDPHAAIWIDLDQNARNLAPPWGPLNLYQLIGVVKAQPALPWWTRRSIRDDGSAHRPDKPTRVICTTHSTMAFA